MYYIIRHVQETKEKNDALREIRRNNWRCPYMGDGRRHWKLAYLINRSFRRR